MRPRVYFSVRRTDGVVRVGPLLLRWRPAAERMYSQRQHGLVIGSMWVGVSVLP